jgi:hypothetical protein
MNEVTITLFFMIFSFASLVKRLLVSSVALTFGGRYQLIIVFFTCCSYCFTATAGKFDTVASFFAFAGFKRFGWWPFAALAVTVSIGPTSHRDQAKKYEQTNDDLHS